MRNIVDFNRSPLPLVDFVLKFKFDIKCLWLSKTTANFPLKRLRFLSNCKRTYFFTLSHRTISSDMGVKYVKESVQKLLLSSREYYCERWFPVIVRGTPWLFNRIFIPTYLLSAKAIRILKANFNFLGKSIHST